ncbi:hypothetical protein L286_23505 [Sphingobium sp. HDIP04]|nr:hypothetical protein L286_23505 [Sphingobium sp. HDIP04]
MGNKLAATEWLEAPVTVGLREQGPPCMTKRIIEIECLCGAREPDTGQALPTRCWSCGKPTMGMFNGTRRVERPAEGELL